MDKPGPPEFFEYSRVFRYCMELGMEGRWSLQQMDFNTRLLPFYPRRMEKKGMNLCSGIGTRRK